MGIRVQKMLGFGLTNVKPQDPRINWNSCAFTYEKYPATSYLGWLPQHGLRGSGELNLLTSLKIEFDVHDLVAYDPEYGLENVLCISPSWLKDFRRRDDTMDWVEETYIRSPQNENGVSWVKKLPDAMHPFNGSYMDARTGKRFGWEIMDWVRFRNMKVSQVILDESLQVAGLTHKEAKRYVVPLVPDEIRNVAAYCGLFTDGDVWKQLRPMLYCWWS